MKHMYSLPPNIDFTENGNDRFFRLKMNKRSAVCRPFIILLVEASASYDYEQDKQYKDNAKV